VEYDGVVMTRVRRWICWTLGHRPQSVASAAGGIQVACARCGIPMTMTVPFTLGPPRARAEVVALRAEHGPFFGVCVYCGCAGHVDQCTEDGDACQDCLDRLGPWESDD